MHNQVTRNNHYVPVWYQRGFLEPGQSQLHYLDTSPGQKVLADGRTVTMNAVHKWGPKNCFYEYDLYSTHFGTMVNDEVEKYLFGSIDVRGAKAVRAFAGGDTGTMHDSFQDFFEYLDAQKLRTPKGLDAHIEATCSVCESSPLRHVGERCLAHRFGSGIQCEPKRKARQDK